MNDQLLHSNQTNGHKTDMGLMLFGNRQVHFRTAALSLVALTAVLFFLICSFGTPDQETQQLSDLPVINVKDYAVVSEGNDKTDRLIRKLKRYGLWELPDTEEVPLFLIKSYPADLNTVQDIDIKKKVFLHSLLPHALYVRQEALQRRKKFESILGKVGCSVETLDFTSRVEYENQCSWTDFLAEEDVHFIQNLCKKYRTTSAESLLERVDAIPVSIILAQGALESSWGSSRFSREGNSIFGMWTWKTAGIIPSRREEGKSHKVKAYGSILDSVRAYHLTLNRLDSYDKLRKIRRHTDNPLILAEGLTLYSERGKDYVDDIKKVILSNGLQRYDSYSLNFLNLPELSRPVSGVINFADQSNVSVSL